MIEKDVDELKGRVLVRCGAGGYRDERQHVRLPRRQGARYTQGF